MIIKYKVSAEIHKGLVKKNVVPARSQYGTVVTGGPVVSCCSEQGSRV
jgi:hypothetical protein